ncbi:MAG: response regulator transcription factor [Chloroflexi bacterium]|nr:response regulator transcription factor [Chloroflexota bacterium]
MIRVVVADDHHVVRQGLRALLEKADDIQVVGEAADGQEARELVQRLAPDVLVMDIAMPRLDGIQATQQIQHLGATTHVVILSMYSDRSLVRQALRNGARGYLLKHAVAEELLLAVRAVSRGESYLSSQVLGPIVSDSLALHAAAAEPGPFEQLTPREREVLQLIAEGHTNNAIAEIWQVSVKTVEKHRANLMAKLDVHDIAGLVRIAIKHGLVFLDP